MPVYPAQGTIKIDGTAAGPFKIILQPASIDSKIPPATGPVAEDGTFRLSTYGVNDGVPEGTFNVLVMSDPMKMTPVPTTKELAVEVKRDSSGRIAPLALDLTSVKGAKATIGAALPNGGANSPNMPGGSMMPPAGPRR